MMNDFIRKVLSWFYPNKCIFCRAYLPKNKSYCDTCLPFSYYDRTLNVAYNSKSAFLYCQSIGEYNGQLAETIKMFKFKGRTVYARKFAIAMLDLLGKSSFSNYDAICFVPMSDKLKKERGYNQSELLAKEISKLTGVPFKQLIKQVKDKKFQHTLPAKERVQNVLGVYSCEDDLKGQNILLIDDIITTGSTVKECAKVLYKKKALTVKCLAIAIAKL